MAHHCYLQLAFGLYPTFEGLLRRGYLGVDLFFVLSGFVLSLAYGPWFDRAASGSLRRFCTFLNRRIARIWPLHATMLLVILAMDCCSPGFGGPLHTLLANLTMTQAWGFSRSINVPTWSISTEFLAYLLFPALAASLLRGRLGLLLGVAILLVLWAAILHLAPPQDPARRGTLDIYANYSLLPVGRCLAGFILGMLAWRLGQTNLHRAFANAWIGPVTALLALIMLLARIDDLAIYLTLPLIILGMHFGTGPLIRLFAHGPIYGLGVLSYAIYVIHYPLLAAFPFGWSPPWLPLPAFLAILLALSALAHGFIERPGRLLIRRLAGRTPGPPLQRSPP